MKFAKELEQSLVPEWRVKYLDYKQGKKKVKAVARATNRINSTPRSDARTNLNPQSGSIYGATSPLAPRKPQPSGRFDGTTNRPQSASGREDEASHRAGAETASSNPASSISIVSRHVSTEDTHDGMYGSFVPTPPAMDMHNFELPDPAIQADSSLESSERIMSTVTSRKDSLEIEVPSRTPERNPISAYQSAYEVGTTESPTRPKFASLRAPGSRAESHDIHGQQILKRIFSVGTPLSKPHSRPDVDMVAFDHVRIRQQEFLSWMDKELDKVETFYRSKEDEAGIRLQVLREQLHEMRNRRIQEVADAEHARSIRKDDERSVMGRISRGHSGDEDLNRHSSQEHRIAWLAPFGRMVDNAKATALGPHPGANSRALASMRNSPDLQFKPHPNDGVATNGNRDYVRRPYENDVSYRTAKRKLKLALQEHYRGMELLKSYALLNRTAFRKINKKYDKATNAHPPLRFMTEKVSKAWFVNSDVLDGHIHTVEDLYARYFEKGNHKIAVGKLRKTVGKSMDQSGSAFRNGVLIGIGAVFSIQGIISGSEYLDHPDPTIRFQTGYLLQIYVNGGKYAMTIVYYVTLSIYRIDRDRTNLIVFSFFAALNAVYVSTWDLLMDWSLLQPGANKPLLRDVRGFKSTWWYYAAMVIDPILRFNWIFYSIYTHNLQHSSTVSFFVGFSEISRRGMWTLFRVENEHCSNVARFKAFRDVALPYDLESGESEESQPITPAETNNMSSVLDRERTHTSGLSQQQTNTSSTRRRPQRTFTKVLADAHIQDFQKKKKPAANNGTELDGTDETDVDMDRATSSEDDDDEQDAQDRLDAGSLVRGAQGKGGRRKSRRAI
ncbi:hypothetical protein EAF00_011005 [Botryotinia globosa]|nr:hypothetical protein EAF00_011005 [Botryotinia globosa]